MIRYTTSLELRLALLGACLPVLGCQGSPLTLPGDVAPARVHALSGSGQQGTVGGELRQPLVVRVVDAFDRPVSNASLDFSTDVPGAQLDPPTRSTDDSGKAEVRVRLGTVEGIQVVEARLAQDAGLHARFTLTAVAEEPPDDDQGGGGGGGGGGGQDGGGGGDRDGPGNDGHGNGHDNGHDNGHGGDHGHGDDNHDND